MERFIEPCCDKCVHSRDNPCEKFVECRLTGPLCHESEECARKRKAIIEKYSHSEDYLHH